jgi:hypothetical protein
LILEVGRHLETAQQRRSHQKKPELSESMVEGAQSSLYNWMIIIIIVIIVIIIVIISSYHLYAGNLQLYTWKKHISGINCVAAVFIYNLCRM